MIANIEEHSETVLKGTTMKGMEPITPRKLVVPGTNLVLFGTTFINLDNITAIEFDVSIDDEGDEVEAEDIEGATIRFKGSSKDWEMSEEDAKRLYKYLVSNLK